MTGIMQPEPLDFRPLSDLFGKISPGSVKNLHRLPTGWSLTMMMDGRHANKSPAQSHAQRRLTRPLLEHYRSD